jgi:hypothetical protein|nr:MAG TPA: Triple QxxK/R motif-containing protein family [Caudoviricetes sp.]
MKCLKYFSEPRGAITKGEWKKYQIASLIKEILAMLAILLTLSGAVYLFVYCLVIGWL